MILKIKIKFYLNKKLSLKKLLLKMKLNFKFIWKNSQDIKSRNKKEKKLKSIKKFYKKKLLHQLIDNQMKIKQIKLWLKILNKMVAKKEETERKENNQHNKQNNNTQNQILSLNLQQKIMNFTKIKTFSF
jgi:hypothetical protein